MNYIHGYCTINPEGVRLNGTMCFVPNPEHFPMRDFFAAAYRCLQIDYRKFYKMDALSKLGFLASEWLLKGFDREQPKEDMGIVLFNRGASLEADAAYQETIRDEENFFPSPAEFVYTLPNIVTGEIAIRNKIFGETMFYVLPAFRPETIGDIVNDALTATGMRYVLAGWTEVDSHIFDGRMFLCSTDNEPITDKRSSLPLTARHLTELFR